MAYLQILQEWIRDFFFPSLPSYSPAHGAVFLTKRFCGRVLGIFSPLCLLECFV